jgi:SAM-dependent methyltransferase
MELRTMGSGSYASATQAPLDVLRESLYQVKSHVWSVRHASSLARHFVDGMASDERLGERVMGRPLTGLDVLEIGTGAMATQALYFACRHNRVTGIDLEPQQGGLSFTELVDLARENGPRRALKTLARKIIGLDRVFPRHVARQMGHAAPPPVTLMRMDATRLTFPDASFDVVHSYDVLEHVDDVEAVVRETVRVLRPGGLALYILMPYTCENGSHDYRLIGGHRGGLPLWAHLRPQHAPLVRPGAYVNELGLRDVQHICERHMPGATFEAPPVDDPSLPGELRALKDAGELTAYDDEELLAARLKVAWKKPEA